MIAAVDIGSSVDVDGFAANVDEVVGCVDVDAKTVVKADDEEVDLVTIVDRSVVDTKADVDAGDETGDGKEETADVDGIITSVSIGSSLLSDVDAC